MLRRRHRVSRIANSSALLLSWTQSERDDLVLAAQSFSPPIEIKRIVNRSTAASVAYGLHHDQRLAVPLSADDDRGRLILLVDAFGRLGNDVQAEVSLLEIEEEVFEVLSFAEASLRGSRDLKSIIERVLAQANVTQERIEDYL